MMEGYGRINVTIGESGTIEAVGVEAALESTYAEMFAVARSDFEADPQDLQAAIRVIVFGCFWLEATCNKCLNELLQRYLPTRAHPVVWKILTRRSFMEKVSIISGFSGGDTFQPASTVGADLAKVFQLRNRLVHFKDEESIVAGPLPLEKFLESFPSGFGDHPLIADLRQANIDACTWGVTAGVAWLEAASAAESSGHCQNAESTFTSNGPNEGRRHAPDRPKAGRRTMPESLEI